MQLVEEIKKKKEEKQSKKRDKELRRKQRELKRRLKKIKEKEETDRCEVGLNGQEKLSRKIALEERKLLIAQRKLESIRLLDELFARIKVINIS